MDLGIRGRKAIVCASSQGLGRGCAFALAEAGASVVLADWNEREVQAAAKALANKGHKTLAVTCDVSQDAQVEAMVKQTVDSFGRLDAAYNNAGILRPRRAVRQ